MSPPVTLYVTRFCGYCHAAKRLLDKLGVPDRVIDLSGDWEARRAIVRETGWRTVPVIFVGDEMVGGYDELKALHRRGELLVRLEAAGFSPPGFL